MFLYLFNPHLRTCLFILERGEGRNINVRENHQLVAFHRLHDWESSPKQTCTMTRSWTHNPLVCRLTPNQLSHTGQSWCLSWIFRFLLSDSFFEEIVLMISSFCVLKFSVSFPNYFESFSDLWSYEDCWCTLSAHLKLESWDFFPSLKNHPDSDYLLRCKVAITGQQWTVNHSSLCHCEILLSLEEPKRHPVSTVISSLPSILSVDREEEIHFSSAWLLILITWTFVLIIICCPSET